MHVMQNPLTSLISKILVLCLLDDEISVLRCLRDVLRV